MNKKNRGVLHAIVSYSLWGLIMIFWTLFHQVPVIEILCHRIVWSMLIILVGATIINRPFMNPYSAKNYKDIIYSLLSSLLIGISWYVYVWAINSNNVIDASLGYFITPILIVILGVIFNKERLTKWQWISLGLMIGGFFYMTTEYGSFPWVALLLSLSFSLYTFIKKYSRFNIIEEFFIEVAILSIPSIIYLSIIIYKGMGNFGLNSISNSILFILSGFVTATPLIIYASAAKKIDLSTLGILQYILPTIQLIIGISLFDENLSKDRLVGFLFVWSAIIIYTLGGKVKKLIVP